MDVCCGSRMFWFDKQNQLALFCDKRQESHVLCDDRSLHIHPDLQADFTNLPFPDASFHLVMFDPPHLVKAGNKSWLAKKMEFSELTGNKTSVLGLLNASEFLGSMVF